MKVYCPRPRCEWAKDGLCLRIVCPYQRPSTRPEEVRKQNGQAKEPKPRPGTGALDRG